MPPKISTGPRARFDVPRPRIDNTVWSDDCGNAPLFRDIVIFNGSQPSREAFWTPGISKPCSMIELRRFN